jgi:hypothetical protein
VAVDPDIAAANVAPVAGDPDGVRAGRGSPAARHPGVAGTVPAVIAADPNPARVRTRAAVFHDNRGRSDADNDALGECRRQAEERGCGDEEKLFHEWVFLSHWRIAIAAGLRITNAAQGKEPRDPKEVALCFPESPVSAGSVFGNEGPGDEGVSSTAGDALGFGSDGVLQILAVEVDFTGGDLVLSCALEA